MLGSLARAQSARIVLWAMVESIAIDGLVLGFLGHQVSTFVPFAAVALVAMLMLAPTRREAESVVRGAMGG